MARSSCFQPPHRGTPDAAGSAGRSGSPGMSRNATNGRAGGRTARRSHAPQGETDTSLPVRGHARRIARKAGTAQREWPSCKARRITERRASAPPTAHPAPPTVLSIAPRNLSIIDTARRRHRPGRSHVSDERQRRNAAMTIQGLVSRSRDGHEEVVVGRLHLFGGLVALWEASARGLSHAAGCALPWRPPTDPAGRRRRRPRTARAAMPPARRGNPLGVGMAVERISFGPAT